MIDQSNSNNNNQFDKTTRTLIIENTSTKKQIRFYESQYIDIKHKTEQGYNVRTKGLLADIRENNIMIGNEIIQLNNIYSIFYVRKSRKAFDISGMIFGALYTGALVFTGANYLGLAIPGLTSWIISWSIKRNLAIGIKWILKIE